MEAKLIATETEGHNWMPTLAEYKLYWDQRAAHDALMREKLRTEAFKTAKKLARILVKEFSVKKVILYGSVLEKGAFREDSDIDIAAEGLARKEYFSAFSRLMMESRFEVDLKPVEDVSSLLRQRINRGKIIYERRENS